MTVHSLRSAVASYDVRHAAISLWLNSGVPATEVARRAGHGGAADQVPGPLQVLARAAGPVLPLSSRQFETAAGTCGPSQKTALSRRGP